MLSHTSTYVRSARVIYATETKETDTVGTQVGKGEFPVESFEREDPLPTLRGEILNLSGPEKRNVTRIFLFELSRDPPVLPGAAHAYTHPYHLARKKYGRIWITDATRHTCPTYSFPVYDSSSVYPSIVLSIAITIQLMDTGLETVRKEQASRNADLRERDENFR